MKHIAMIIGILCSCLATMQMHAYTSNSILKDGRFVKIRVQESGVYCIPYDSLLAWDLQPANVRIFGYGGQMLSENFMLEKWDDLPAVSFYMHKGTDGVFNQGDYILFYAQGVVRWDVSNERVWRHTTNPYSNYGYYFLSDNVGEQKLIAERNAIDATDVIDVDWFVKTLLHERDSFNLLDAKQGINGGGREFYGEVFNTNKPILNIDFSVPNVDLQQMAICYAAAAVISSTPNAIQLAYADSVAQSVAPGISVSDFYTKAEPVAISLRSKPTSGNKQVVQLKLSNASEVMAYLNYVELHVPCKLQMVGQAMAISNITHMGEYAAIRFILKGASQATQIWRVTDGVNIERMPTVYTDNQLVWVGDNTKAEKYYAVTPSSDGWKIPTFAGKVQNQNLHALNDIDYVIICARDFLEPALKLAKKHEEIDHLTWAVATDEQVYNEFSSGTPDASAYRWFVKMLYDRASNTKNRPKSLLLFGRGTFDNRKILSLSGSNKLLTFQAVNSTKETLAYATDDYFGFMQDDAGVDRYGMFNEVRANLDVAVGRLPAKDLEEANNMVDKLCVYMDNKGLGKWKTQILFLADDGDHGLHVQTAEGGAELLRKENKDFIVHKVYLDSYTQEVNASGERYPLAKNKFDNLMNQGVLMMNYSGHGGYNNITNELFMRTADIKGMTNKNQGVWFLATCSFSHCDGGLISAGEEAVLNPNGGAIGVLSACRTVYATQNTILNRHFCDTILGHKDNFTYHMTIGDAVRIAKNKTGRDINKLPYIFLGDPALRLNYPTNCHVQTTSQLDTVHALSVQTIKGYIQTADNDTADWFNGYVEVTVFDKMQQIVTQDNDEPAENKKTKITYNDYPNTLFAGKAEVKDGKFECTFMVPKDIRYNYGSGRIAYYACDEENRAEAIGHFENFIVGGSSTVEQVDTLGPELNIYLNSPMFKDGDTTHEYPYFFADIYDENGINTVGSGIGHDLLLIIDSDPKQTYVLNDYFTANNSYQSGQVCYRMAEQKEGEHSLTFRAWDLMNNSSSAELHYSVVRGVDPQIFSVMAYPNPVSSTGLLHIQVAHDQVDRVIETQVQIFNLSGQLVHQYKQNHGEIIQMDMRDVRLNPGMYLYQVSIRNTTSVFVSRSGKLIVTK